jgi:leader peptidase (prepilin peptidase) / N-methyltransferase
MIRILGTIFAGLLGLAFGSFLNVVLSRWPAEESVVRPRSHCRHCTHSLSWWENIPLISWLFLRGRCRNCHTWIGWRYPLVELAVGVLWAVAVWDPSGLLWAPNHSAVGFYREMTAAIGQMIFYWLMVALAVLDFEHLWLPDVITLPGTALGIVLSILLAALDAFLPANETFEPWQHAVTRSAAISLLSILAAAGLVLLIRWFYWLIRRREGIGLGDVKLMALLAAWLGLPCTLLAFAVSAVLGFLAAVILLAVPSARTNAESWATTKLPFGTFLCIGGIVGSLWGQPIIAAYLRMAGL